jgi:hypothetical protein
MCQQVIQSNRPRFSEALRAPTLISSGVGAALGYTLATTAQASGGVCLCSALSGALIGNILPRFASDEEMRPIHWALFCCGTLLAATALVVIVLHTFNPAMLGLCPFCGQALM